MSGGGGGAAAAAVAAGSSATGLEGFVSRYGGVFVWHAVSISIAWCLLAPVGYAWMRASRRAGGDVFRGHRTLMVIVVIATIQAWAVAAAWQRATPPVHGQLGSAVLLLAVVQATWGQLRPSSDGGVPRHVWAMAHRVIAILALVTATYTCHHSIFVFKLPHLAGLCIHIALGFGILAILSAELAPISALKRILGIRSSYFDDDNDDLQKYPLHDVSSSSLFRDLDEDNYDDEHALSLVRTVTEVTTNSSSEADDT